MAKKSTVTQVPMLPYRYWDIHTRQFVTKTGVLRAVDYVGETLYLDGTVIQPVLVDNVPFDDVLAFQSYYRGRSAAGMSFLGQNGTPYNVFLSDFVKFVQIMERGIVKGKFIYAKKGMNYGLKLYE